MALFLASEQSDWLTGRVISSSGYEVGLYENPQIIRQVSSTGAVGVQQARRGQLERSFRPAADGLPFSVFASQLKTN